MGQGEGRGQGVEGRDGSSGQGAWAARKAPLPKSRALPSALRVLLLSFLCAFSFLPRNYLNSFFPRAFKKPLARFLSLFEPKNCFHHKTTQWVQNICGVQSNAGSVGRDDGDGQQSGGVWGGKFQNMAARFLPHPQPPLPHASRLLSRVPWTQTPWIGNASPEPEAL